MAEKDWDPKRTWYMVPVRQFLIWGEFASYQQMMLQMRMNMMNRSALEAWYPKNAIPVFISHRWDTPHAPDPTGRQVHIVVRFLIEAICLSKGICERFFSYAEPEIVLNPKLRDRIKNHETTYMRGMQEMQDFQQNKGAGPWGKPMEILLADWLQANFPSLTFQVDEIITISNILRDVIVWYDFTCMPQKPYSSEMEERYFQWALKHLKDLISITDVVVIWDKPAINRGWCLFEGIIAETLQNASYDASPNTNWGTALFNLGETYHNQHPNKQMSQYIHEMQKTFSGMGHGAIVDYFRKNGVQCTKPEDLDIVAGILSDFINGSDT